MTLFDPIDVGGVSLRNRLVKSAMGESMANDDGCATQPLIDRYERWSRGGVALCITGTVQVMRGFPVTKHDLGLFRDEQIPSMRCMAEAVHRHGGKIFCQLNHAAPQVFRSGLGKSRCLAPSPGFNRVTLGRNRAALDVEIREIAQAFGAAAARARAAGVDGVQIHGAHGYLVSRFVSPKHNRRKDCWGSSFAGRLAFLREIVACIRRSAGQDYPVAIKLNAHDGDAGGLTLDDGVEIAKHLEQWGVVAIEVSAGTADVGMGFYPVRGEVPEDLARKFVTRDFPFVRPFWPLVRPLMGLALRGVALEQEAYFYAEACRIAEAVSIPVMAVGGIRTLERAESILEDSAIAMVSMARPLVCQPNLPNLWSAGRGRKAACSSCNRCFVSVGLGEPIRCHRRERSKRASVESLLRTE